jgi:hypothetical protein
MQDRMKERRKEMAKLFNRMYTRKEILEHVGDISQLARIQPCTLTDGLESGTSALNVHTGSGLDFTVLPGRGMDISRAAYCGLPLSWRSAAGDQNAFRFEPDGIGWLRTFPGGLVSTCGLSYAGAACEDQGRLLGLHGRINHIPASNVQYDGSWEGDEYILTMTGKMREAVLFGENIQLTRKITVRCGDSRIYLHDMVQNMGYRTTPHMILYHINIGYPVVSEDTRLSVRGKVIPRDDEAARGAENYDVMHAPVRDYKEKCYFIDLIENSDHQAAAALYNSKIKEGIGFYVSFDKRELPYFTEWKMLGQGEYVVGLEPGNCLVLGRAEERKSGRLQFLEPGEIREYHLELGVLEGETSLNIFKEKFSR